MDRDPRSTLPGGAEAFYLQGYQDAVAQRDADDWTRSGRCGVDLAALLDRVEAIEPRPHLTAAELEPKVFDQC